MNTAVVALGSNIDPASYLGKAREALARRFTVRAESSWTRTKPVGRADQPDFLNGVVFLETDLDLAVLKGTLKDMENVLGRVRREDKSGPREIDLDVLFFNGQVVDQDYYTRDFLQKSVQEILPALKTRCC